jgi:ABC-type uncharacterized transport system ATPase subunit
MSQKVQFIATVVSHPELIILDEPFTGLDPVNADVLTEAILDLRNNGTTVILSTHDMNVAEKMCDFILMIFQGSKVLDGTLAAIQDEYGSDTIRLRTEDGIGASERPDGVEKINDFGKVQELQLTGKRDSQQIVAEIMSQTRVTSFELTRPSCNQQRAETRARSSTNRPATKSNQSTSSKSFRRTKEPQIPSYWSFPTGFDAANYIPLSRLAREYSTHAKTGQRRVSATMRRTRP